MQLKYSMIFRMKCEEHFPETGGDDTQQRIPPYRSRSLSDLYSVVHPVEMASQDTSASLQSVIRVAASDLNALATVPICKARRSEIGQRHARMPFSVGEVEALVEAVEQLGTGRSVLFSFFFPVSVDSSLGQMAC